MELDTRYNSPMLGLCSKPCVGNVLRNEHHIAKQAAFVNHYAEMRLRWKAACFLLCVVFLRNHFCINQPTVLKASFLVQLKCTSNRNLIAQLRIIIGIGMFTRKNELQSL